MLNPESAGDLPEDVKARGQKYLDGIGGRVGAYSHSKGHLVFRKDIADMIEARDGEQTL